MPEFWKEKCQKFCEMHVMSFTRIFQTVLYLLGFTREETAIKDTNMLDWRKVQKYFLANDMTSVYYHMNEYSPYGQKKGEFKVY